MNLHKKFCFVLCCASFASASISLAMEIEADGTYVDEESGQHGLWSGRFLVGGPRLEGRVTMSGPHRLNDVPIEGTVEGSAISFNLGEIGIPGFFEGSRENADKLSGALTISGKKGAWEGRWKFAQGSPAPELRDDPAPLAEFVAQPAALEARSDDAHPTCRLLRNRRSMMILSSAARQALRHRCGLDRSPVALVSWWDQIRLVVTPLTQALRGVAFQVLPVWAQGPPTNRLVNNRAADTYPRITQSESSVGVSGSNQQVLVIGYNDSGQWLSTDSFIGYARSTNQGTSWSDLGYLPPQSGGTVDGDPVLGSDSAGRFYFAHVGTVSSGRCIIGVSRSTNDGQTFGSPVDASPGTSSSNFQDKPEMSVDRRSSGTNAGNVYVCWTEFNSSFTQTRISFSRSTNQGVSYSTPLQVTGFGDADVSGCSISVGPQGNVWLSWYDYSAALVKVKTSTDGGQSFGTTRTIGTANLPSNEADCDLDGFDDTLVLNGDVRESTFANLAADPLNGSNVYAAWNHFTAGSSEISFSRSTDGGTTWSTPVRINDTVSRDQFSPRIATTIWYGAEPDSTIVSVTWYDRRNDASNLNFDLYGDGSSSLGASWTTDSRWTDSTSTLPDINPNQDCETSPCYLGDYNGMFSLNPGGDLVVSTWGDSRLTANGSAGTCPGGGPSYPASRPDLDIRAAVGC